MLYQYLMAAHAALMVFNVAAVPVDLDADAITRSASLDLRQTSCGEEQLSNETWIKNDIDAFLANASQHYTQYPTNNVQALAAYLGAPNFYCGVNEWCNAGQPCTPVGLPGWYVLMGMQSWNNYINNLNLAVTYSATIIGLKLPKLVDDLWPKKRDGVTPLKMILAWVNGLLNAFPTTAVFGATAGGVASAVQGNNIIASGMMIPPGADGQYVRWSDLANQMGSKIDEYKRAIGAYAQKIIDAPINETQWGINKALQGGAFLTRDRNVTQDDFDNWMYRTISVNAMGLLMQAQNVYIIRTFNKTDCDDSDPAFLCRLEPNNKWTEWRFQRKGSEDNVPENRLAKKLVETYGLTKEQILKGPTDCFDSHDYEQLTNPWETVSAKGISPKDPIELCNFNVNICNMDVAEGDEYGPSGWYGPDFSDWMCELQGLTWTK
ncbi:uncharacterized protein CTRU02_209078 [Colletotrichum truncatum]|uniref:Uncharacterized protein n=1 Tax=Colletotrichum truncatum TaxID=5467 RepID=A0ACC3YYG4_COLTU|nr:uncharacterized protein CTRU02_07731 [Colletotrichum truncatum]KAF6790825.1 hypothetical protein CTRU02_07731 [Colletotrichum truncatum]